MVKERPAGKHRVNRNDNIHRFRKALLYGHYDEPELLLPAEPVEKKEPPKHHAVKHHHPVHRHPVHRRASGKRSYVPAAVFLVFLLIFSVSFGFVASISSKFALMEGLLTMMSTSGLVGETNLLIVGLDAGLTSHRTDTIMVVHINPNTKQVSAVSIPRDTLVDVPGVGLTKVNHAFAYGGMKLTRRTLERFLGVSIPFTVCIDMGGLAKIIDSLGGIVIDVEKRMYYVDYAGGLFIDLYPGRQLLDGKRAIGYVRFRRDAQGDFGRISRQQKFVKALANRIISQRSVLSAPGLIMSLLSNLDTNMNSKQILGISMSMRQSFDLGNIEMATIPGTPIMVDKIYYMRPDEIATHNIVNKLLMPGKSRQSDYGNVMPISNVAGVSY